LAVVALVLTVAAALAILAGLNRTGLGTPGGRPLDYLVFATVWSYVGVTPVAVVLAVLLGNRRSWWIRTRLMLAAAWIAFMVWTTTMTL